MDQRAPVTLVVAGADFLSARHSIRHGQFDRIERSPSPEVINSKADVTRMANIVNGMLVVPRRNRFARSDLSGASHRQSIEALVLQAYLQLVRVPWTACGSRSSSLAKFGSHEVRLVERKPGDSVDFPHLWVELYANDIRTSIDACGCDDIEAAAIAAEEIMSQAWRLEEDERSARGGVRARRAG